MPVIPTIRLQPPQGTWLDLGSLISALVNVILIVAALLAFLYLLLGGISWITSGGDKTALESARNKVTHAIIGLIIVAASWSIMVLVSQFLGLDIFNPAGFKLPSPR